MRVHNSEIPQNNEELEVKFYLVDLEGFRVRLERMGAKVIQPRTFEHNLRFDTSDHRLTKNAQVLRLRKDTANRLTYKGPGKVKDGVSARKEIEIAVEDFDNTLNLLEALGYQVSMTYEKYRAIYEYQGVLITLDEMPFGNFAEIEGPNGDQIHQTCKQAALLWELRTLQSYTMLFEIVKRNLDLELRDLTFANFAEIKVGPSHLELAPADL
jgi:adenylate cyclase class 2